MNRIERYAQFRKELDRLCIPVILSDDRMTVKDIEYNGVVVGIFCAFADYIDCVYVEPEYRRKGLAKQVVIDWVKRHINYGVRLHIINSNEPAKAFWNSLFELKEVGSNPIDTLYEIVRIRDSYVKPSAKPKFFCETHEEYLDHTSRCASCVHSRGVEDDYVCCYNADKSNYPYAIDNSVECDAYERSKEVQSDE